MELHALVMTAAAGELPDWASVGPARLAHIQRVAALMDDWSRGLGLDEEERVRWRAAAYLHDALREADPETLRGSVPEELHGFPGPVLHGPAAAERLRVEGVRDRALLRAVGYHTVGHPQLDALGRALYCADFLDPGRPFLPEWRETLRSRMPSELDAVTREIVAARLTHLVAREVRLLEPTVAFWNVLVASGPAADEHAA
jgi:2-amino-4-hydroxy-6-hydroxymethyldihydropteridine diphosphokinase